MRLGEINLQMTNSPNSSPQDPNPDRTSMKPPWYNKPWMYKEPKDTKDFQIWIMDWGNFLLRWCEHNNRHIISLQELLMNSGFHHSRHPLQNSSLVKIFQGLVDQGLAKWANQESTRLRVYWKGLDEWSEIIYKWCIDGGGTTMDIYQLEKAHQQFSNLPYDDLEAILSILVQTNRAEWLDKIHKIIQLQW